MISMSGAARRSILLTLSLLAGCRADQSRQASQPAMAGTPIDRAAQDVKTEWFVDRAVEAGLDFVHFNGMSGGWYMPEIMGPGVAMFDYNGDGALDLFVVQGQMLGVGKTLKDAIFPPREPSAIRSRLYRNDLKVNPDGTRTLHFTDVTEASGIDAHGYGMGAAAGDFNNDGCIDLYVTNFGPNQLFRNNCDGTFTDVTKESGTADPGWSVSAAFVDYDRDGWLDLFVCNYLDYTVAADRPCFWRSGERDYCSPSAYRPKQSHLYHNNRNGTFTDVTATALIGGEFGPGLGVVAADFNGDGWIDLYVANDGQPNQLWMNQRNGTFKNTAFLSGAALNAEGRATAAMGVDAGDFDNDGDEDLFFTNMTGEMSTLFVNDGSGAFEDRGRAVGLALPSRASTGFGAAWFDFDNDGWLDMLTVNGAVRAIEALALAKDPFPFRQRKQLFRNLRNGRFEEVTGQAGKVFQLSEVGRGAAFGDIDNDGDVDVVVANDAGPVRLLINEIGNRNHWLGVRVVGRDGKRDMVGARVGVVLQDGKTLWRRARADGSYASSNDPRVLVGLGSAARVQKVRVVWPDGRNEAWADVPADRWTTLKEGSGQ